MPRMRDVPHVFRRLGWWTFLKRVYQQVNDDNLFVWAAALAYSWLFAIFPFLIFLLSLLPLVIPQGWQENLVNEIERTLYEVAPGPAAEQLTALADAFLSNPRGGFLTLSLLIAIWTASGGMSMTMAGLDKCYDIKDVRPFVKQRLIAILLTITVAVLVLLVLILLPIMGVVLNLLGEQIGIAGNWVVTFALNLARYVLAVALLFVVIALIYYYGPSLRTRFHLISPGAVFVVTVWLLLGFGFNVYVNRLGAAETYERTYGAVGGVAILLLLFYVDALVLMIGAEINAELDFALLGIPSDDTPEGAAVAHKPPEDLDEEDHELAEQILTRRQESPDEKD